MPKQTNRAPDTKQGIDALQSLLNDQAEARLRKEIDISRSQADPESKKAMSQSGGDKSRSSGRAVTGAHDHNQGFRKQPSMRETKAQLIGRMEILLQEMDKTEARLEQKILENERIEKDAQLVLSDLQQALNEKKALEQELKNRDEAGSESLFSHKELEKKNQEIEIQKQSLGLELEKKERHVAELEKEIQDLESRVADTDTRLKELSSLEDDLRSELEDRDSRIYAMQQEIQSLQEENSSLKKEMGARKKEAQERQDSTGAEEWKKKADELWDGVGYTAPQKAIQYLSAALELKPDWAEALNDRGLASLDDYQMDRALDDFTAAIALKGDFAEAFHNRGVALLKTGKKFAARKDFQVAARYGLWLGLNALAGPAKGPGFFERIKNLLGIGRKG